MNSISMKEDSVMGWIVPFVFSLIVTVLAIIGCLFDFKAEMLIGLGIFLCCDILFLRKFLKAVTGKTQMEKAQRENQKDIGERTITDARHQAGLPLAQDAVCTIFYDMDCFRITGGGNTFELPHAKLTDISVKTDTEIQRQYVSSVGGAIAGDMVFGPLGAIVGGRAKQKKTTESTYYLIFTYNSNNQICYASFQIPGYQLGKIGIWETEFKVNHKEDSSVVVQL